MKINSAKHKKPGYPCLAAVAALLGTMVACEPDTSSPPSKEEQVETDTKKIRPDDVQILSGIVAYPMIDGRFKKSYPQNWDWIYDILQEGKEPTTPGNNNAAPPQKEPQTIPQNAVGSVPCPDNHVSSQPDEN